MILKPVIDVTLNFFETLLLNVALKNGGIFPVVSAESGFFRDASNGTMRLLRVVSTFQTFQRYKKGVDFYKPHPKLIPKRCFVLKNNLPIKEP